MELIKAVKNVRLYKSWTWFLGWHYVLYNVDTRKYARIDMGTQEDQCFKEYASLLLSD